MVSPSHSDRWVPRVLLVGAKSYVGTSGFVLKSLKDLGLAPKVVWYTGWNDPGRTSGSPYSAFLNRCLRRCLTVEKPDILLILKGEFLDVETLALARKHAGCVAAWWFDDPRPWPDFMRGLPLIRHFFIFDPFYVGILKRGGAAHVEYLPLAFDSHAYSPRALPRRESWDFSFVGTPSAQRILFLSRLKRYKLRIVGPDWIRQAPALRNQVHAKPTLSSRETCRLYRATRVAVNLHHPQSKRAPNQRTFEVAGSGTFQLVDSKPELGKFFRLGEEMVTFKSLEDFHSKADYYLSHPDERRRIAAAASRRAHAEHTYAHRVRRLLEIVRGVTG